MIQFCERKISYLFFKKKLKIQGGNINEQKKEETNYNLFGDRWFFGYGGVCCGYLIRTFMHCSISVILFSPSLRKWNMKDEFLNGKHTWRKWKIKNREHGRVFAGEYGVIWFSIHKIKNHASIKHFMRNRDFGENKLKRKSISFKGKWYHNCLLETQIYTLFLLHVGRVKRSTSAIINLIAHTFMSRNLFSIT